MSSKILFLLILLTVGLIQPVPAQTNSRRKKLKATPILKTNQRSVKVKSYVRKGKTVRAHKRTITIK
ncbi:MAG TPA: hypothetical protein VGO50_14430 [Pyrinomonadaceae bacterium]|nr:hypothetical protein [Pyrinomonadaceae bacterium]